MKGERIFQNHYFTAPFCIVCLIFCLLIQIHYLNVGLELFEVMLYFPLYQSAWILFVALGGIVTYQEYSRFTVLNALLFPLGMMITFGGLYMLIGRKPDYKHLEEASPETGTVYAPEDEELWAAEKNPASVEEEGNGGVGGGQAAEKDAKAAGAPVCRQVDPAGAARATRLAESPRGEGGAGVQLQG